MLTLSLLLAAVIPVRVSTAPHIDGHLDDPVWSTIPASGTFTQSFPRDAEKPSAPTRIQVAYDDENLYVAIDCVQTAPRLARLTRRDRNVDDDRVGIDIDTAHDRRSAFHFQVSAAGVLVDGLRYEDTELNTDWDEIWDGEVANTATGWSAEIRIPLRILRLHAGVSTWGFQVRRWIGATGELDTWAYAPRDAGGEVSRYGDLGPFDGLAPRQSIALVPFALTRAVRTDPAVPSQYGDGLSAAVGLDATWRPRSNLVISASVLPDFGQVEADQVVLNLTTTEVEYPEKRPFFLQGMDLFQTPIQLLYTRRIGRAADSPVLPDGVDQLEPVGAAPVLGAAKIVANAGGIELGMLSAVTGGVNASYGRRNLDGLVLPSGYQWNLSGTGKGLWEMFLELHWRPHYFDDRELGDGRALERSGRLGVELSLRSDPHRSISAGMSFSRRGTHDGSETYASGSIALRPRDNVELDIEPDLVAVRGEPRFVDGSDPMGPRFARLDATSLGVTTRATWTLQRNLTLQAYVQALFATLRYRDGLLANVSDRVIGLDELRPGNFDPASYDGREGALNATIVGRWEYRPGSTAFLVYSHAQIPSEDGTGFDPRSLSRGPAQDVVLLKLSWAWLR